MKFAENKKIDMLARHYGYFPASFRWRGRRFEVEAVEQIWTEGQNNPRRIFQVRATAGPFVLAHHLADDTWQVVSSPLVLWRLRPPRPKRPQYPLPLKRRRIKPRPGLLARLMERTAPRPTFSLGKCLFWFRNLKMRRAWTPALQRS